MEGERGIEGERKKERDSGGTNVSGSCMGGQLLGYVHKLQNQNLKCKP